jgi:two-component system NarL family sensor kinase
MEFVEERAGIALHFKVEEKQPLPPTVEAELYHVVLEALNNVVKHAHAQRSTVYLQVEEGRCHLTIQDDGTGFDPEAARLGAGQGLRNMRERVAQIGGRLSLQTDVGSGTRIDIDVTLREHTQEANTHENTHSSSCG